MTKSITCFDCGKESIIKPTKDKSGRPWKKDFCNMGCYSNWKRKRHLELKKNLLQLIRSIWGTTEINRFQVHKAKKICRIAEVKAKEYLKNEGFKLIADMSGCSNQFFVDFIYMYKGKRVLVDATIKIKAYIPDKIYLANNLGMDLYIIHVSPTTNGLFYIKKVNRDNKVSTIPMIFIRNLISKKAA